MFASVQYFPFFAYLIITSVNNLQFVGTENSNTSTWIKTVPLEEIIVTEEIRYSSKSHNNVVVCELENEALKIGDNIFDIENKTLFDGNLCTHVMYTNYFINDTTYEIESTPLSRGHSDHIDFLNKAYPNLSLILSVYCTDDETSTLEALINSKENRKKFISNASKYIKKFGYNGLDMNVNAYFSNGKERFTLFAKELKDSFQKDNLLISTSVQLLGQRYEDRLDIARLSRIFDFVILDEMDSAYYDAYSDRADHQAPLYSSPKTKYSMYDDIMHIIKHKRANPDTLVLGIPFSGHYRKFKKPFQNYEDAALGSHSLIRSQSVEAPYRTICSALNKTEDNWTLYWDTKSKVPILINGTNWISFENPHSVYEKAILASKLGLKGVAVWSVDADDFKGQCSSVTQPLLKVINQALTDSSQEHGSMICNIFNTTEDANTGADKNEWIPIVSTNIHNISLAINKSIEVQCIAEGRPLPKIYWMKITPGETTKIPVQENINKTKTDHLSPRGKQNCGPYQIASSTMTIKSLSENGRFICLANNSEGEDADRLFVSPLEELQSSEAISLTNWVVIGLTVTVLLLLVGNVVGYVFYRKRNSTGLTEKEITEFLRGKENCLVKVAELENNEFTEYTKYDKSWEIDEDNYTIDFSRVLGSGNFGFVCLGKVRESKVAVKSSKNLTDKQQIFALLAELKIMTHLDKHANIVSLIGASTKKLNMGLLYIFLEYCPLGNLENYLRNSSVTDNKDIIYENTRYSTTLTSTANRNNLTVSTLLNWSYQVARALDYIGSKKIIHGDLAARNILVFDTELVKVTDFGLSRKLYEYGNYTKKSKQPLPWRWMAIESLRHLTFSTKSDVWSFGITLWEIFSLGDIPFPGISWTTDFVEKLQNNFRPHKPHLAPDYIYDLMLKCWNGIPGKRPSPEDIYITLQEFQISGVSYTNVNESYLYIATEGESDRYSKL